MSNLIQYKISSSVLSNEKHNPKHFLDDYRRAIVGSSAKEIVGNTLLGGTVKMLGDIVDFIDTKYITSAEELKKYTFFPPDTKIDVDTVYILHPLCSDILIEKDHFFTYIIEEQINEIISFVTSANSVDKLIVSVLNNSDKSANLSVNLEEVSGSVGFNKTSKYLSRVELGKTPQSLSKDKYMWIKSMPTLVNAVNIKSKNVNIKQEVDNSFGINMSIASVAGVKLNTLKHCCFEIVYSVSEDGHGNN